MRQIHICLLMGAFTVLAVTGFIYRGESRNSYDYVGSNKCAECHAEEAIGNQVKIWKSTGHSKAFLRLDSEIGRDVAKKASVADPQKDPGCLKCHTTGGGRSELTKEEGVGCEACHGPGSGYHETSIHVDYSDPTRVLGYTKAIKNGMYPVLGIVGKHLKNREKLCTSCHKDTRPCAPDDAKTRLQKKMTIQVVDKLQRGDVRLRHPLHR